MSTYVLPRRLADQLDGALSGCRYKGDAIALATFLGRFWSLPSKLGDAFHVDRRALANRPDLMLSERRIRRALEALLAVGFLSRMPDRGSGYRMTEDGLRRKPALYRFGAEWWKIFSSVCRRAAKAVKDAALKAAGHPSPSSCSMASRGQNLADPKRTASADSPVHMGPVAKSGIPPKAFEPNPNLESALERLLQGIRLSRGSGEGGAK